jgi:hypothetical protein
MRNDSYSLYGIHNKTERQLLVGYRSFISMSTLIGDTLILIGSLPRYNAIQLHRTLVMFIRHMAVADILQTLCSVLPGTVSLIANGWNLGDILCHLSYTANASCEAVLSQLSSAITLTKLLIVKNPLGALSFTAKSAHMAACCMWIVSFTFPLAAIARNPDDVSFSHNIYNCMYTMDKKMWTPLGSSLFDIAVGLSVFTCNAVTVGSSVALMVLAKKAARRIPGGLQWQGVFTVLSLAAFHTIVCIPMLTYFITCFYVHQHFPSMKIPDYVYRTANRMFRCAWNIALIQLLANFYLVTLTVPKFRNFVKSRLMMIATPLMKCCTVHRDGCSTEDGERRRLLSDD